MTGRFIHYWRERPSRLVAAIAMLSIAALLVQLVHDASV